ncbi:hypothetical protein MMC07_001813 [Pseudocyphellaria aurata]|nr:hypothetical protein [Pseudocyphellaria aurata]
MGSGTTNAFHDHLEANRKWANALGDTHPELLDKCSKGQSPSILWLGCSDSRVPETTVLGGKPGDIFVHRNIANVLHPGDMSATAVITYAVKHLKVNHVVICGHTLCGGVNAALGNDKLGLLDTWLLPIRRLRSELTKEKGWKELSQEEQALKLVEANVKAGVRVLLENQDVIDATKDRGLTVHGAVYNISKGLVEEVDLGEEGEEEKDIRLGTFGMK